MSRLLIRALVMIVAMIAIVACKPPRRAGPAPEPIPPQPPPSIEPGAPPDAGVPELTFASEDFVESDIQNRDPFRSYAESFRVRVPDVVQRHVVMPRTGIEEMHLIAIISGVPQPRAMLVDRDGVGHVVKQGDFVGRAEVIQSGGADGTPIPLNWRVDRIRPAEIVLTRSDLSDEGRPPLTRVIPLREQAG